jgi:hypothetical protein
MKQKTLLEGAPKTVEGRASNKQGSGRNLKRETRMSEGS